MRSRSLNNAKNLNICMVDSISNDFQIRIKGDGLTSIRNIEGII